MWLGPEMYIVVNDPVDVEAILNSPFCLEKDKAYRLMIDIMGSDGLVSNIGIPKWSEHKYYGEIK